MNKEGREVEEKKQDDRTFSFSVEGMTCASCVRRVETELKRVSGIDLVSINLASHKAYVVSEKDVSWDHVSQAVKKAGYKAVEQVPTEDMMEARFRRQRRRFIQALAVTLPLMTLMIIHMTGFSWPWFPVLELVAGTLVLLGPGRRTLKGAWIAVSHRHANMDTLVSLGALAAWSTALLRIAGLEIHSFGTLAAMLLAFHLTGRYIEGRLKYRANRDMRALMALQVKEALVADEHGEWVPTPVEAVKAGSLVLVRNGERVPLDGNIAEGSAVFDESMVTGESVPVRKEPEMEILGGTVLTAGRVTMLVTRPQGETYLNQMMKLIEEAQSSKVPIQASADRVAAVFIPIVFTLALAAGLAWFFFYDAFRPLLEGAAPYLPWVVPDPGALSAAVAVFVATLVIACPCALGLATPMALVRGSGAAARQGILIKNGEAIQRSGELQLLFLDKTGTITQGAPYVVDSTVPEEDMGAVFALEQNSLHPLAEALKRFAGEKRDRRNPGDSETDTPGDLNEEAGRGITGHWRGSYWEIGKPLRAADYAEIMNPGGTLVEVRKDQAVRGVFRVQDPVKPSSAEAVRALKEQGITPVMLSGDNEITARAVAAQVGIQEVHAGIRPEDKLRIVQQRQKEGAVVGMAGDGINDAAALKAADVGFAMGTGTDLSMESGDIILHSGDLTKIRDAALLSRKIFRTIRQNLFWAFLYNLIAIPVSLSGLLHPALAELAMTFSSINVILNSLRIGGGEAEKKDLKEVSTMQYRYYVKDMTCGHCTARVKEALEALEETRAEIDLSTKLVRIESRKAAGELEEAIRSAGYTPESAES